MINLFSAATASLASINPLIPAMAKLASGTLTQPDGSQLPSYTQVAVEIDVQALSSSDLTLVQNIAQQSDMRAVYLRGALLALNRPLQCGGDLLSFYGSDWLVTQQVEEWGDGAWTKVLVTRQTTAA